MATQAERRNATTRAIIKAARKHFGRAGYAHTTVDQVADTAGVAKGAVYHHFPTKTALFEAVLATVSEEIGERITASIVDEQDILRQIGKATRIYFDCCANKAVGRILLQDGPAVLGWERWREIDMRHFGSAIPGAIGAAIDAGIIRKQPVEPVSQLILGAITEAALACGARKDLRQASDEYAAAVDSLLESMRLDA